VSYLLDTCVLSEFARKKPDARVLDWLSEQHETDFFLSVVAIGELAKGVTIGMADGLIGATAAAHAMLVITRNTSDIAATGAAVFNPWTD